MRTENLPASLDDIPDPERLSKVGRDLFCYHRPTVEPILSLNWDGPVISEYAVYDESAAAFDALSQNSLDPLHSRDLVRQIAELVRQRTPNYDQIMKRREVKKTDLEQKLDKAA